jgi:hypothetical protein
VIAWPADYQTLGVHSEWLIPHERMIDGLKQLDIGVKEWIGLAAYRLTDKTDEFYPAPGNRHRGAEDYASADRRIYKDL